jgi:hypothetical protein
MEDEKKIQELTAEIMALFEGHKMSTVVGSLSMCLSIAIEESCTNVETIVEYLRENQKYYKTNLN